MRLHDARFQLAWTTAADCWSVLAPRPGGESRLHQAFFKKWGDEGEVDLLQELSDLIILTASRCLMGKEVRESLFEKVSGLFHYLDMGMRPISVIFPYLPIKAHRDRDWARAQLAEIFAKIINNRRDSGVTEPDVLQVCAVGGRVEVLVCACAPALPSSLSAHTQPTLRLGFNAAGEALTVESSTCL